MTGSGSAGRRQAGQWDVREGEGEMVPVTVGDPFAD